MDVNKFVIPLIAVFIGAVLFVGVLPVFDDVTATEDTYTNEGYFRMSHYTSDDDEITVSWTYEKPKIITVNGEDVTINFNEKSNSVTVIADTNFLVRLETDPNGDTYRIYYLASTANPANATVSGQESASFVFNSGTMTATLPNGTRTATYTDVYLPSNAGVYTMKKYDKDAMLNSDSEVFAFGVSRPNVAPTGTVPYPGTGLQFTGSIDDGITGRVWRTGGYTTAVSDELINTVEDTTHNDLYKFQSITATVTITQEIDDEEVNTDTTVTYNYLIVPYQVIAERSVHPGGALASILDLLPLIIGSGLVIGVVGVFLYKRMF